MVWTKENKCVTSLIDIKKRVHISCLMDEKK